MYNKLGKTVRSFVGPRWADPIRYFFILALLVAVAVPAVAYAAPTPAAPMYVSFDGTVVFDAVTYQDDDILKFDGTTWTLHFDGSDVGLGTGNDITALAFLNSDTALFVFDETIIIDTVTYTSNDIVRFERTSWGTNTAGTFSLFMAGAPVGLDALADRIDSLSIQPDGSLLISTTGNPIVPGVVGANEADILKFTPTTPGDYTSGSWSLHFDASDVGLDGGFEDVSAIDVVGNVFHLATFGVFDVGTVSGTDQDVFTCTATSTGSVTACTYDAALYFDGSAFAAELTTRSIDAFSLDPVTVSTVTVTGITANNKVYDSTTTATLNTGSAVLAGVAGGDDVQLVTTGAAGVFANKNVGTGKTVTISGLTLTGADAANYSLTQPTATANITARDLTADATGVNKVYTGTNAATVTFTSDALVGDVVTFNYAATFANANVGNGKAVTVSSITLAGADAGNYNLLTTSDTTTANITQAPLTVTANNQSKTVSQPDPAFTFTYSGFVNGETSAVINTQPTCTVSVPHTAAGTYPIVCSGGADDNYSFTYVNGTLTVQTVMTQTFDDVPTDYWAWSFVERLYAAGITGGCATSPDLLYCPDGQVTRAEMAVFLLKSIHGSSYSPPAVGASTGFGDVSTTYWAAAWIKQLAAEGITGGCGNGNYCPDATVTRAQMAVFLLKAKHGSAYNPPAVGASTGFGDVATTYWAAAFIKQLVAEGITAGCGNGNYCPETPVTRAQMAVFLVRTFNLP
jgi:hypothetical protein